MKKSKKLLTFAASLFALTVAVSCGGGGTSSGAPTSTDTPVSEPAVSEPVSEPEVSAPEVSEPVVSEPVVSEPEVSEPEVSEPVVSEPEVDTGLEDAVAMLNELMKDVNDVTTTSFTVPAIIDSVDYTYQIDWSLDVKADGVEGAVVLGEKTEKTQAITIKYEEGFNTVDTYYDLKAVVNSETSSKEAVFDGFKVPQYKYSTIAEWIAAKDEKAPKTIQGVVTAVSKLGEKSSFTLTDNTGTVFSYDGASEVLNVGDEIVVSSIYSENYSLPQLKAPEVVRKVATDQLDKVSSQIETVNISEIKDNLNEYKTTTKYMNLQGGYIVDIDSKGRPVLSASADDTSYFVTVFYHSPEELTSKIGAQVDFVCAGRGGGSTYASVQVQSFNVVKEAEKPVVPEDEPAVIKTTIAELAKNAPTEGFNAIYEVTGTWAAKDGLTPANNPYGNGTLSDAEGNSITIYGLASSKSAAKVEWTGFKYGYTNPKDFASLNINDGDEITVGMIYDSGYKNYLSFYIGDDSGSGDVTPEPETPTYVTSVEEKKAYNLMIEQKGLGKNLYYAGGYYKTYYGAPTENVEEAVDIVLKATNGGYYVGYLDNGTSTFINAAVSGTHNNIKFETTPTSVWTFNEEYDTLVTTCGENQVYIGTYGTYDSISLSTIDKITSETNYPARLYESKNEAPEVVFPGEVTPEEPEVPEVPETSSKIVLTVDSLGLASQSYSSSKATVSGVEFEWIQLGNYGDGIQVRDSSKGTSYFWNTVAFESGIEKIEMQYSSTQEVKHANPNAEIFYFGNDATVSSYSTKLSTTVGEKSYTITPDVNTYTFLKFEHDLGYSMYWDSITIYLAEDASGEETTNPESVAYIFNNGTVDGVDTSYVYDQKIEGSSVEWNGLTIDATSGKLAVRDTDTQMNEGTVISFDVEAGATVVVTSYPGYHNYTVNDVAVDADAYTVTFTEASTVTIVATGSAYLYSIVVTY